VNFRLGELQITIDCFATDNLRLARIKYSSDTKGIENGQGGWEHRSSVVGVFISQTVLHLPTMKSDFVPKNFGVAA
jgi:hypothetical protein